MNKRISSALNSVRANPFFVAVAIAVKYEKIKDVIEKEKPLKIKGFINAADRNRTGQHSPETLKERGFQVLHQWLCSRCVQSISVLFQLIQYFFTQLLIFLTYLLFSLYFS